MKLTNIIGKYWILLLIFILPKDLFAHIESPSLNFCGDRPFLTPTQTYMVSASMFSIGIWIIFEVALILMSLQIKYKEKKYLSITLNLIIILFPILCGILLFPPKFTYLYIFVCLIWLIAGYICWLLKRKGAFFFKYHLLIITAAMGIGMAGGYLYNYYKENIKSMEIIKERINSDHIHSIKYTLNKYYGLYNQYPYSLDILCQESECSKWLLLMNVFPFLEDKDIDGKELAYEPIFDEEGRVFNYIFGGSNACMRGWTKPEFADYELGIINKISGKYEEAVRCFNKVISAYPESIYARFASLKIAECQLTKEDSSVELYQKIVEMYPKTEVSGIALFKIGNSYFRENQYEKALFFYQKAFEDSHSPMFKDICEKRLGFIKENSNHNYERLRLYNEAKDCANSEEAVKLWNGLVKKYPDSMIAQEALCRIAIIPKQIRFTINLVS